MIVENKGKKETSRLRMVRINMDCILQTSIFWLYLSSWVNSSKQPLANSISSILNKGTIILCSKKFQIVRKLIDVESITTETRRKQKKGKKQNNKMRGRGGEEIQIENQRRMMGSKLRTGASGRKETTTKYKQKTVGVY